MANAKEYIATELWHRRTGSYQYYIDAMQAKAAKDNAPIDALYESNGNWVCMSDLAEDHPFRAAFAKYMAG